MITLAIESATNNLSVALLNKNKVITSFEVDNGITHSPNIMDIISYSLKISDIDKNSINIIAVDIGPGAFTSIRVGVSTARALAQFIGCDIIPVSSLDVLREAVLPFALDKNTVIIPMIDGRKKRVYTSIYQNNNILEKDLDITMDDLIDKLKSLNQKSIICGTGALLYHSLLKSTMDNLIILPPEEYNKPHGIYVGLASINNPSKRLNYNSVVPNYIRKSDAEIALKKLK